MNKLLLTIIAIFLIGGGMYFVFQNQKQNPQNKPTPAAQINNFEDCATKYPVMESYPRQCNAPDGKHFVENIGNEMEMGDLIKVDSPRPNAKVSNPLTITGQARGTWYFEASFPIKIADANGQGLGTVPAQAQEDWMTKDFVPFTATIEFAVPTAATGNLILKNDNPSGDPSKDKQLIIPIKF
jgi:hypothetical protein